MNTKIVSIIIPTYNEEKDLPVCFLRHFIVEFM